MLLKDSPAISWGCLIFGIGLINFLVFICTSSVFLGETNWPGFLSYLYVGFSRTAFVVGLGMILLPLFYGRCRFVSAILGAEIFIVLS